MKQICVSFPRIAVSGSEAPLSEALGTALYTALQAIRPITMVVGSPVVAVKAFVDNADDSQDAADALAQGVCNVTLNDAGYHASEIASTGVITELAAPTPTIPV